MLKRLDCFPHRPFQVYRVLRAVRVGSHKPEAGSRCALRGRVAPGPKAGSSSAARCATGSAVSRSNSAWAADSWAIFCSLFLNSGDIYSLLGSRAGTDLALHTGAVARALGVGERSGVRVAKRSWPAALMLCPDGRQELRRGRGQRAVPVHPFRNGTRSSSMRPGRPAPPRSTSGVQPAAARTRRADAEVQLLGDRHEGRDLRKIKLH